MWVNLHSRQLCSFCSPALSVDLFPFLQKHQDRGSLAQASTAFSDEQEVGILLEGKQRCHDRKLSWNKALVIKIKFSEKSDAGLGRISKACSGR